jgi:hypothetical protein
MQWLDSQIADWVNKVDLGMLNMQDNRHCILGQLYGNVKPRQDMAKFGMMAQEATDRDEMSLELWYLQSEWARQTLLRRQDS